MARIQSSLATMAMGFVLVMIGIFSIRGGETSINRSAIDSTTGASILDGRFQLGSWIWAERVADKQTCRLWRAFEVPASNAIVRARLRLAADNGYRLFLDGRELGRGSDWKYLTDYDLTWVLTPGTHVIAVEAFNEQLQAGVIAGLRIEFANGSATEIASDASWRVVPEAVSGWELEKKPRSGWPAAVVKGKLGTAPWTTLPLATTQVPPMLPIQLRFWQEVWFQILMLSACLSFAAVSVALLARLTFQRKAQELLQRERNRIARDIHDDVGAGLTQLVLIGEVAQSELQAGSELRERMEKFSGKAREVLGAMDEIVWVINSRRDTVRDFASHVCKFAQAFLRETPIRCRLDVETDLPATPFELPVRRNLFLAVKEALNNVAKHSSATELLLYIHRNDRDLVVRVEDNGKGFDRVSTDVDRNGLVNMAERTREMDGRWSIESQPGKGCCVTFRVPIGSSVWRRLAGWQSAFRINKTEAR